MCFRRLNWYYKDLVFAKGLDINYHMEFMLPGNYKSTRLATEPNAAPDRKGLLRHLPTCSLATFASPWALPLCGELNEMDSIVEGPYRLVWKNGQDPVTSFFLHSTSYGYCFFSIVPHLHRDKSIYSARIEHSISSYSRWHPDNFIRCVFPSHVPLCHLSTPQNS